MSWKQHSCWPTAGQHIKCKWVCAHRRLGGEKTKRGMQRKKSPGRWIPGVTHLRPSHTHVCSHLLEPRRAARSVLPPAGIFFSLSLSAKWSLCPHENLWHLIPAEKWAGRRFDHKSASSHSSQSASALRGTEFVLFNLAWGNAGAIGIDLVQHVCCFVSVDGCKVTLFSLWGKGLQAF